MPLQTRKPTGLVPFPLLLVEGEEKSGKSFALAQLSASERVGRCFYLEFGDGVLDQYAPLGDFDLLVHNGTWASIIEQIRCACAEPSDPERPNVVAVDSGTAVWFLLKSWTDGRARNSRSGRAKLRDDPDAEIDASMNLWNDAKGRWGEMVHVLQEFPGIGIITAWGHEVTRVEDGAPTTDKVWTVEAEKNLAGAVSAWVRMKRPHVASLVGVRSLSVDVPADGLLLPNVNMLDHLVFEVIGAGKAFTPSTAIVPEVGTPIVDAKAKLLEAVQAATPSLSADEAKAEAGRLWKEQGWPSGRGEVKSQEVDALVRKVAARSAPPKAESSSESPAPAPSEPSTGQEAQGPTSPAPGAPGEEEPPDDTNDVHLGGRVFPSSDEALRWLRSIRKPEAVTLARARDLPTNGTLADIVYRIAEVHGLLEAPFDVPAEEAPREPWAKPELPEDPPLPEAHEALPEVRDVPEGYQEGKCLCGEPLMYRPGNVTATIQHLSPELDAEHTAEEVF